MIPWNLLIPAATTAIGAGASLFGKKRQPQTTQLPRFDQEQQGWISQSGKMAMEGLRNPMAGFEPIAQQARNQFTTQTVPSLAERFTAMGQGGQRSSDFAGAVGGSGEDFEANLASMGSQYGLQRISQLQQLLGMGLTPQNENIYREGGEGRAREFGSQLMGTGMQGLFNSIGSMGMRKEQSEARDFERSQQQATQQQQQSQFDQQLQQQKMNTIIKTLESSGDNINPQALEALLSMLQGA